MPSAVAVHPMVKSTIGRFVMPVVPLAGRVASAVAPCATAAALDAAFTTPARHEPPERERAWLADALAFRVHTDDGPLAAWSWGRGPVVLLVHGWSGRGAQLGGFVAPLVRRGYRVVAWDAPGHGASSGRRSSIVQIAEATLDVARAVGAPRAIVAHSAGAAAVSLALGWGLRASRLVYVATPGDLDRYLERAAGRLGISPGVVERARRRIERRLGFAWADLPTAFTVPHAPRPLLIVHDRDDRETDWRSARALADLWPGASLLTTRGLGHRRILRDPAVVERVAGFVAEAAEG